MEAVGDLRCKYPGECPRAQQFPLGGHGSGSGRIQNGLKQGKGSIPLLQDSHANDLLLAYIDRHILKFGSYLGKDIPPKLRDTFASSPA